MMPFKAKTVLRAYQLDTIFSFSIITALVGFLWLRSSALLHKYLTRFSLDLQESSQPASLAHGWSTAKDLTGNLKSDMYRNTSRRPRRKPARCSFNSADESFLTEQFLIQTSRETETISRSNNLLSCIVISIVFHIHHTVWLVFLTHSNIRTFLRAKASDLQS